MSLITSLNKQATNLARKALRLGNDFVHPGSDDSGNTPDYNDPNSILSPDGHIELPHTAEWGPGYPSTTFLDPETGLLTTKTEGNPPLDEGTSIYDIYADRAARMGDEPLYTFKQDGDWHTKTANETLADIRANMDIQAQIEETYRDPMKWSRMAVLNVANSGYFSSDRSIEDYLERIWHTGPLK